MTLRRITTARLRQILPEELLTDKFKDVASVHVKEVPIRSHRVFYQEIFVPVKPDTFIWVNDLVDLVMPELRKSEE